MRLVIVATLLATSSLTTACARPPTPLEGARPEPSTRPNAVDSDAAAPSTLELSSSSTPAAPPRYPSTLSSADPPLEPDGHGCEPIVRCGVWSRCVWLDRIGPGRYRERGKGDQGAVFVRRRECWPSDAGPSGCAVHCTGADAGPPCYDGLHPEDEVCTGAAVPRPNSAACQTGDGICGSFI